MKIESLIRRAAGSTVRLGANVYRFQPDPDGRHVAEVEDEGHIDVLLANRSFRAVDSELSGEVKADGEPKKRGRKPKQAPEVGAEEAGEAAGEVKADGEA